MVIKYLSVERVGKTTKRTDVAFLRPFPRGAIMTQQTGLEKRKQKAESRKRRAELGFEPRTSYIQVIDPKQELDIY